MALAMRIEAIDVYQVEIPFRRPFVVWRGAIESKRHVLVRIRTDAGLTGWGEASPFLYYAPETAGDVASMVAEFMTGELIGRDPRDVREIYALFGMLDGHEFAKCAVETALWDILAQSAGLPLYRLLGGAVRPAVPLLTVLHHDEPAAMGREAAELVRAGFARVKIKIGFGHDQDEETVARVREAVGPAIKIRVDAEEHYATKEALAIARRLEKYDLELLSQPVARTDWQGMALLRNAIAVPLLADEGIHSPADVMTCVHYQAADMVNIKVVKSGGLIPSLEMAAICQAAHYPVVLGSMIEGGIGTLLGAHFALATPAVFSTELCGPLLFADTLLDRPLEIRDGQIWLDETPGLGAGIDLDRLEAVRVS
jgi:o-succinylbenzoate synthase